MLFFAMWKDRPSLIIDAVDLDVAIDIATKVSADEGAPSSADARPSLVQPLPPGVFVASVEFVELDDEHDEVNIEPLDHVAEVLAKLEDAHDAMHEDTIQAPAALRAVGAPPSPSCPSEAEDEVGVVIRCDREAGHDGEHSSGSMVWCDDG